MNERVLITGATGCVGRALAHAATAAGAEVVALARRSAAGPWAQCLAVDVTAADELAAAVAQARPDVVVHAAGRLHGSLAERLAVHAQPVPVLLEALHHASPRARFVLVGSVAEYGAGPADGAPIGEDWPPAPDGPHGVSKQVATQLALAHGDRLGIAVRVARVANVLGPGLSPALAVGSLLQQLQACRRAGRPYCVQIGDARVQRDWIDAGDVARGLLALARHRGAERVFHLASGRVVSLADVVATFATVLGAAVEIVPDPRHVPRGPAVLRLQTAAAARALAFAAEVPLAASLQRMWHAATAAGAEAAR